MREDAVEAIRRFEKADDPCNALDDLVPDEKAAFGPGAQVIAEFAAKQAG